MSDVHRILCGGLDFGVDCDSSNLLRLNLWGGAADENVQLRIEDFHEALYRDIPSQFADLVEIAAYVYCADQALKRTGQDTTSFGGKWRRNLHFYIPVRCVDLWKRTDIKAALIQVLDFLSEDSFSFDFFRATRTASVAAIPEVRNRNSFRASLRTRCDVFGWTGFSRRYNRGDSNEQE